MKEENQAIIKALNMYGRVPEQWELLNEIERLNNIINELEEQSYEDYKLRIDKAISYLEKCESMGIMGMLEQKYAYVNIPKVLEILRGGNND